MKVNESIRSGIVSAYQENSISKSGSANQILRDECVPDQKIREVFDEFVKGKTSITKARKGTFSIAQLGTGPYSTEPRKVFEIIFAYNEDFNIRRGKGKIHVITVKNDLAFDDGFGSMLSLLTPKGKEEYLERKKREKIPVRLHNDYSNTPSSSDDDWMDVYGGDSLSE